MPPKKKTKKVQNKQTNPKIEPETTEVKVELATTSASNDEQGPELITTLTPITEPDGSGRVRYYVDQGHYYYDPDATEVQPDISSQELTQVQSPNTMLDNEKLVNLLKSTDGYIVVLQPSEDSEENQIVETQSQALSYQVVHDSSDVMIQQEEIEIEECEEMEEVEEVEEVEEMEILDEQDLDTEGTIVDTVTEETEVQTEAQESENEAEDKASKVYEFEEEDSVLAKSINKIKATKIVQQKNNYRKFSAVYHCPHCSYSSSRKYLVVRHMKSHSEARPFVCSFCDRTFKTVTGWQNHINTHKGRKPHVCSYCKTPFTTSGELVRHVRYKHTLEKPHKCNECDYASVELSKLKRHQRCHTGERPYQCRHCTYASPDTFKLKRHLRTHTGEKPYKCDVCNLCFTQSNSLKNHKLIHNGLNRPVYKCVLCPATCGRKTDLRIHIKNLHSTQKSYKCKRCGKVFPDRYTYKVHNKSHDGEKCFKCEFCPYASATIRHLKSHVLKHTGEKPFQCDQCDQTFRQKQLLRRHENLYHNPDYVPTPPKEKSHECNKCHRQFAHKGNLIRHLAVHDTDHVPEGILTQPHEVTVETEVNNDDDQEEESEEEEVMETESIYLAGSDDDIEERVVFQSPSSQDDDQYLVFQVVQVESDNDEVGEPSEIRLPLKSIMASPAEEAVKKAPGIDTYFGFESDDDDEENEATAGSSCKPEQVILNLQFNDSD